MNAPKFYTKQDDVTWHKEHKYFCAETSMLTRGGTRPLFGNILSGVDLRGLVLVSSNTGKEIRFALKETIHDSEGELIMHILKAHHADMPPGITQLELHILND